MLSPTDKHLCVHSVLYEKIPESHLLKMIGKTMDFSFINYGIMSVKQGAGIEVFSTECCSQLHSGRGAVSQLCG